MRTKEQIRSEFVLNKIQDTYNSNVPKDDANFMVGAPTMILQNGLGQTFAFLLTKNNESKYRVVIDTIKEWATLENENVGNNDNDFLQFIAKINASKYLDLQQETLAILQWLKRYARAFQEGE